ncbi:hypothetical protein VTN00DRAFT_7634 [Thermoascus crustaceus]|uniref:uncharacterized protein n=1 Tax=Thermoascus crustaceus TaxID=5088 RepID=UPI0037428764
MQRALEILGIPTYHMNVVLTRPSDVPLWSEALDAKFYGKGKRYGREEWDKLVGEFGALSDTPVLAFAEDLVEAYPEAKVILVERDPEEWKRSFEGIIKACWDPTTHFIANLDSCHSEREMREKAIQKYKEHYALVRRVTPPERLLEYKLGSGWEPLCEFLGKPVPEGVPFPHVNDSSSLRELLGLVSRRGAGNVWKAILMLVAAPAVVAWVVYRCL